MASWDIGRKWAPFYEGDIAHAQRDHAAMHDAVRILSRPRYCLSIGQVPKGWV